MKPPHSLSDVQLRDYADEHLQYELDMLRWSATILGYLSPHASRGPLAWAINNGLLNTFATHARNLINFLYSRSSGRDRPSDIIIEDYLSQNSSSAPIPPIPALLKEALTKAGKQVAHLTKERIDYEKAGKEWRFGDITNEILTVLVQVAPRISAAKLSDKLRARFLNPGRSIPIIDVSILPSPSGADTVLTLRLRN